VVELLALSLLLGLATWRLTSLLHTEDTFEWLRKRIGIEHDEEGWPVVYPDTESGKAFHCFWCLTVPLACGFTAFVGLLMALAAWTWPIIALASSAVAIWLEKQIMRSRAR